MDGSTLDNGLETCMAGATWVLSTYISASISLTGIPLSNNITEVAAVILALKSWPWCMLHIHTDSSFVLHLVCGSLLALEQDGWPSFLWLCHNYQPLPPADIIHVQAPSVPSPLP